VTKFWPFVMGNFFFISSTNNINRSALPTILHLAANDVDQKANKLPLEMEPLAMTTQF